MVLALTPEQLRRHCAPEAFTFKDTSELPPERTIYGQPRGVRAIEFGIDIDSPGYNIYVLGPTGSGRVTAIRHFIDDNAKTAITPDDWCYVHSFKETYRPRAIRLPAGQGRTLKADMEALIATLRDEIPRVFEGEMYMQTRNEISRQLTIEREKAQHQLNLMATEMSLAIQSTPQGMMVIVPVHEGQPITQEDYDKLPEEVRAVVSENRRKLEDAIEGIFRSIRTLQVEADARLDTLRRDIATQVIDAHLNTILEKYETVPEVKDYLNEVREDVLETLDMFEGGEVVPDPNDPNAPDVPEMSFSRYGVNVFVEHQPESGAPVCVLDLPTYQNLVGRIEHVVKFGVLTTDFMQIKSGGLQQANGGFLIIRAEDILKQPFAWEALKRALNTGQVVIEDPDTRGVTVMATQQLEPEPIPLRLKVVLVGSSELYYGLHSMDEDFQDLFRVKADFGDTMHRTAEAEMHYARFIATRCAQEKLPHFDASAVGRIVDYGSWLVADQRRLSTQFGQILTLVRESAYYARKNKHTVVTASDVQQAIHERDYRNNEAEELSQERISDGSIFLDLEGMMVGQVNALVVITLGDHTFGLPSRITARVYMGRENVVQIDRESEMTGPIHDKGVMTLEGYLGGRYAQDYPLTLTCTLAFEQNYGGVEGDSASSTELYALLSALSGLPIRQDLAVTGSVNQRGQIQPIGGVTQKIEGFYKTCKIYGLTGSQGVIIPKANVPELMLNEEVVNAVAAGQFHVYAVTTVEEGMELLTGCSAEDIHAAVDKRLRDLAEKLVSFEDRSGGEEEEQEQTEETSEEA